MKTLYDLLGALPEDDADDVRAAFRKAAKANHPDINPDDPDAALRFRQILRANAILGDPQQRAAYDRLLALTVRQPAPKPKPKRVTAAGALRKLAFDTIAVASLSTMSIGGYLLFDHLSKAADVPPVREVAATAPAENAAAAPAQPIATAAREEPPDKAPPDKADGAALARHAPPDKPDGAAVAPDKPPEKPDGAMVARDGPPEKPDAAAVARDGPPDKPDAAAIASDGPPDKPDGAAVTSESIVPSADAPAATTASAQANADPGPAPEPAAKDARAFDAKADVAKSFDAKAYDAGPSDAKSYRERGIIAYRDGDLPRAIADFDQAIRLDHNFAEAYIDRGIALYRMHEFDRAFADISRVKRIRSLDQARAAEPAHKASPSSARN